jgi:hypothetical protein
MSADGGGDRFRVVRVEEGAPVLAVQHKDAPAVLGIGRTSSRSTSPRSFAACGEGRCVSTR